MPCLAYKKKSWSKPRHHYNDKKLIFLENIYQISQIIGGPNDDATLSYLLY